MGPRLGRSKCKTMVLHSILVPSYIGAMATAWSKAGKSVLALLGIALLGGCATQAWKPVVSLPVYFDRGEIVRGQKRPTSYETTWKTVFHGQWGRSLASVRVIREEWERPKEPSLPGTAEPYQEMRAEWYTATVELTIGPHTYVLRESASTNMGSSRETAVRAAAERMARRVSEHLAGHGITP